MTEDYDIYATRIKIDPVDLAVWYTGKTELWEIAEEIRAEKEEKTQSQ